MEPDQDAQYNEILNRFTSTDKIESSLELAKEMNLDHQDLYKLLNSLSNDEYLVLKTKQIPLL